jgi:hypothetical protein
VACIGAGVQPSQPIQSTPTAMSRPTRLSCNLASLFSSMQRREICRSRYPRRNFTPPSATAATLRAATECAVEVCGRRTTASRVRALPSSHPPFNVLRHARRDRVAGELLPRFDVVLSPPLSLGTRGAAAHQRSNRAKPDYCPSTPYAVCPVS